MMKFANSVVAVVLAISVGAVLAQQGGGGQGGGGQGGVVAKAVAGN